MFDGYQIGDRVRFRREVPDTEIGHQYYPPVGTYGKVTDVFADGTLVVQWPKGATCQDDRWCCAPEDVENATPARMNEVF